MVGPETSGTGWDFMETKVAAKALEVEKQQGQAAVRLIQAASLGARVNIFV